MKTAVLIIDMQEKVYNGEPKPYEAAAVIERINSVTAMARQAGMPVIFSQHEVAQFLEFDSEGWQLVSGLVVEEGDQRLRKAAGDVFLNTDLHERLQAMAVNTLIIMGYASEICVDSTTRRAVGLGYKVVLVSDAHTTTDKAHLSAVQIREHHNLTLGLSPMVTTPRASEV